MERPHAPTPEQTNYWLQGMDQEHLSTKAPEETRAEHSPRKPSPASSTDDSPRECRRRTSLNRPRSPTPMKMLAWEDTSCGRATQSNIPCSSDESDHEGRGDHADSLIAQLIGACQMNDINKAFIFHEKLRHMKIPVYEGVYKMIIECCMRTQQLGHAMKFYETLRASGHRVSSRLVSLLMEACAREQHGDKVYAIWNDWCPPEETMTTNHAEILLLTISALLRAMSPDLARDALVGAVQRFGVGLTSCLAGSEHELEEIIQLNKVVSDEAKSSGTWLEEFTVPFSELNQMLVALREQCAQNSQARARSTWTNDEDLLMVDVDLDLELAAQ